MGTCDVVPNNSARTATYKLLHGHSERTSNSIWEPVKDFLIPWIIWYMSMKFGIAIPLGIKKGNGLEVAGL